MNLLTQKREYLNSVLDDKSLGWLLPVLETGQATCKTFMKVNNEFFNCTDYLNTVPGNLLTYSIYKELSNQCILPLFPFEPHKELINKRNGYSIPVLKKDNVTISILRSSVKKEIINSGEKSYLKEKCLKNNELDNQISLFDPYIYEEKNYHGVLLYGSNKNWEGLSFADIVFFDSQLKQIHHSIDLLDKLRIYETSMTVEEKEKSLLNANNIIKDAKNNFGG